MAQETTTAGLTRVQRRKERMLAAIVEAAERQFLERSYANTTLEAVATAADVGVGTIYSYFSSKDDLFLAVIDRGLDLLEHYQAAAFSPELSPRQQLLASGETYLRFACEHPRHFLLFNQVERDFGTNQDDPVVAQRKARLDERVGALIERLTGVVQRIVASSEHETLDALQIARFLWGAWNGVILLSLRDDARRLDLASAEAALNQGRRLLIAGLEALLNDDARSEW